MTSKCKELCKDRLYSFFEDMVRVEIAPQIVQVKCEDDPPKRRVDSLGKPVKFGEMMAEIDWKAKIKPKVWRVYLMTPHAGGDSRLLLDRFIPVYESEDKEESFAFAEGLKDKALANAKELKDLAAAADKERTG